LSLAALGVVFGDIGTSPLYTLKTVLNLTGPNPDSATTLGALSLILWTLLVVTTIKYVNFAMRIDNHGEGGIIALLALLGVDPVGGAPGPVGRAEPLRHDAFEAKLTSMAKHHVTRLYDVVVNLQPYRRFGEQLDQQHLAALDGLAPQVI